MSARTHFTRTFVVLVLATILLLLRAAAAQPGDSVLAKPQTPSVLLAKDPFFALASRADGLVIASVASSRSYWAPAHDIILTEYRMTANTTIRGDAPASFSLIGEGGEIGDVGLLVSDAVSFQPNVSYVIALENGAAGLRVVGGGQGIRRLDSDVPSTDPFLHSLDAALRATDR